MNEHQPLIFLDPHPRTPEMIFDASVQDGLGRLGRVVSHFGSRAPASMVEDSLADMEILIGQTDMPAARLQRAAKLRAIVNVKGNWEPNIDYACAQERGVSVLTVAPVMAPAVAEWVVGAFIDLGRGLAAADRDFRRGRERYGLDGCRKSRTLHEAKVGLVGMGNLGRALLPLLRGFTGNIAAYDPWMSSASLERLGARACSLDEILAESAFIAILAGATVENQGFLGRSKLAAIKADSIVVLASRAAVVDFDALIELGAQGRFRLAVDVYPEEPVEPESAWREAGPILFSAHRAGADPRSYRLMREAVLEDVGRILAGEQPQRLQRADARRAPLMSST